MAFHPTAKILPPPFLACDDVSRFPDEFCKSDCAKPVYNYVNECGEKADAAVIDFACSKSPAGTNCLNIIMTLTWIEL